MRYVILAVLVLAAAAAPAAVPPPNDDCANARVVGALPYTDVLDTTLARPEPRDANYMTCGVGDGPTVWYKFVPPADGFYCAKTCGSDYDTVLSTVRNSCLGQEDGCSDDDCFLGSAVGFDGTAGVPVLMVIGAYEFSPKAARGGNLRFTVRDASVDTDGDGIYDCDDNCNDVPNTTQEDTDFDGLGNVCEDCTGPGGIGQDADGDGICGFSDRCPFVANPDQADADGDFSGDACDQCAGAGGIDDDLDGVCDDAGDNCPGVANPDQLDSDGDFVGDACDTCPGFPGSGTVDSDGDGIPDLCDLCPNDPTEACTTIWGCLADKYSSPDQSLLVRVNPATGLTKTVGSLGTTDCRALAFEPGTGRLLAIARSLLGPPGFDLFEVDPATAAITRIGPVFDEFEGPDTIGMAFRGDGTLFAVTDYTISLVDPTTGTPTYLANGLSHPGGLTFDGAGRLLFASENYSVEIDQTTGDLTDLPALIPPPECDGYLDEVRGLAFTDGTLYAAFTCYPLDLLGTVDPSTGALAAVGVTPHDLTALTAEVCGNGTREGNEECDDGNTVAGDCCSPTCRAVAAGTPCTDDGSVCTSDACDGSGTCAHAVPLAAGCAAAPAGRAAVTITPGADPKLTWRWRGTEPTPAHFGPPTSTTDLTLCIGNAAGGLFASATAPLGGLCQNGEPCWRPKPTGYDYKDLVRTPDGLEKITLRASPTPGRARIKVKARGPNLAIAPPPYSPPLVVRLVRDDGGGCWEAVYSTPRRNDGTTFKAVSD